MLFRSPINAQQQAQQQHDDLFGSSSQPGPGSQGGFRFGAQNAVGQSSQPNPVDEFPPLNRNANGEIGQDRLIQNVGFGSQSNDSGFDAPIRNGERIIRNNGLLAAVMGSSRNNSTNERRRASPGILLGKEEPQRLL